eukprot:1041379-Rhodomonas_salina.1
MEYGRSGRARGEQDEVNTLKKQLAQSQVTCPYPPARSPLVAYTARPLEYGATTILGDVLLRQGHEGAVLEYGATTDRASVGSREYGATTGLVLISGYGRALVE